ncbi:36_t:CDS:2, partial [Paraglomus occultum]
KPGIMQVREKAKWTAWSDNNGMSKEDAQAAYIAYVETLKTKYSQ